MNIRYAVDSSNMEIWCSRNEARYLYVPTEGPTCLFEFGGGSDLLTTGLPTVDEVRPTISFLYFIAGQRHEDKAKAWAADIDSVIRQRSGGNRRIALDRVMPLGVFELQRLGYEIVDGFEVMENARLIKSPDEITLMRHSIAVCEQAIAQMREALQPGITENALWAELHRGNIAGGGEWIECRLLASGPRTNPWFRESSMRGHRTRRHRGLRHRPHRALRLLQRYLAHLGMRCAPEPTSSGASTPRPMRTFKENKALLKPGVTFREVTEGLRPLGDEFVEQRYVAAMHGVGLCDEYPVIHYPEDWEPGDDGVLREGMVLCVEALTSPAGGRESVKLEEQVLITADGYEQLSSYPMEESWL